MHMLLSLTQKNLLRARSLTPLVLSTEARRSEETPVFCSEQQHLS